MSCLSCSLLALVAGGSSSTSATQSGSTAGAGGEAGALLAASDCESRRAEIECQTAVGPDNFDCGAGHRDSSPGAYGAYRFIDFDHYSLGIWAHQGELSTFRDGDALFSVIAADSARWATVCEP